LDGLADFYTIKKKQFTVLTGIPGAGKSAFLDCMLVNLALRSGWKFAVTSVENQPLEDHLSVLLEIYAGQPFSEGPTSRMSLSTVNKSLDWFQEHFYFVLPDEQDRTLGGIISLVNELEVDGVVVDPWNELEHRRPAQMTETEYVSQALSRMRHHARLHDQHWWLVAHPTKLQKDKSTGKYLVPTLYDIAGSAHFRNKADFGLVVWRDADVENGPSTVFVQKVRFRWCGKLGQCDLYFDRVTGRFSEQPRVFPIGDHRNEWIGQAYEETA
jgi:twinkle protein